MSRERAELTPPRAAGELLAPFDRALQALSGAGPVGRWWRELRADEARMLAVSDTWRALWTSRLLVWVAGVGTILALGFGPVRHALNPSGMTTGFGRLGDLLAAPAARWDAAWYLLIAHGGYRPELGSLTASRAAFFPLYPLGIRAISSLAVPPVIAGVLLSVCALAAALYGIHRLTTLELGRYGSAVTSPGDTARSPGETARSPGETARLAVLVTAFAPMAFFFSAVYSESLYLALSVGLFWSARQGRWALAGLLGALAACTRSTGVLLIVPALMLYLYGPREDRPPDHRPVDRAGLRRLAPRYRVRADSLSLLALPLGVGLYMAYLGLSGADALSPFHAQGLWGRHFAGPYVGAWDGIRAAFEGARQLLAGPGARHYFPAAIGSPDVAADHNLMLVAFLLAAVPAVIGVLRVLPLAYGVYVLIALALPLSYPVASQPLMSLPRFLVVLFPLGIWLASWLARHPRAQRPALLLSAALMACFLAQFATWHWVA
jgi:hypothetical protein